MVSITAYFPVETIVEHSVRIWLSPSHSSPIMLTVGMYELAAAESELAYEELSERFQGGPIPLSVNQA